MNKMFCSVIVSEDKPKSQEDTGSPESEGLKLVRQDSKKLAPPNSKNSFVDL